MMIGNFEKISDFLADSINRPATAVELEEIKNILNIRFTDSYRAFQLEFGDFCHKDIEIFTVSCPDTCCDNILEVRSQKSEVRSQKSEVRSQKAYYPIWGRCFLSNL